MSKRQPNEAESRIHQAALASPKQEITIKQVEALVPDAKAREKALNFLLSKGLIKALQSSSGLLFRAVSKSELNATKDLNAEEALVYSHIQGSKNEGIWTKQLKAKTNLHQTIIDRCLKTLVQKAMIKRVPSVQHPTRKIYMLEGLEPSIALTGGPWYTDNELDTEFIKLLMSACLRFIQEKSFPKRRSSSQSALYPISNAPEYPTAQNVRTFLKQSRITETDLSVEHVEMLLNVLVLDGEIEKLPAFGATLWDSSVINQDASSDDEARSKKKRKSTHDSGTDSDSRSSKSKRKKRRPKDDDDSPKKKRSKSKKRQRDDSDEESDPPRSKKKKKKIKSESESESESESDSSEDENARKRKKIKTKKSKKPASSSSESEPSNSSESESESNSDNAGKRKSSKVRDRTSSPNDFNVFGDFAGGANIYRAVKQEKMALGWSQAPCGDCPSFDFCKDGGPVNPKECVYYDGFLLQPTGGGDTKNVEEW